MAGKRQPVRAAAGARPQAVRQPARPQAARSYAPAEDEGHAPRAKQKKARHFYDYSLLFCIIFLTAFGLVMIYSASSYSAQLEYDGDAAYFMMRQAKIAAVGFVMMLVISKMDYHFFARFALPAYGMSYVLMIAVSLVGIEANGKKRWLGVGPVSFQPTEFVKIALIVMLAAVIAEMGSRINRWKNMGFVLALTAPVAGLVAMNNLSSGIIIFGIAVAMLFVACRVKWPFFLGGGACLGILCFAGPIGKAFNAIGILQDYQYNRILAWLNPESDPTDKGFQVLQGLYAIGSGGLLGLGLGQGRQKYLYLPEEHNDFIFAIICEELGYVGAGIIMVLFALLIIRGYWIAIHARDRFGALLVVGVTTQIGLQVFLNIAVVTGLIPATGISLPFFSYGGTALMIQLFEVGIVLSVSRQMPARKAG